MTETVEVLLVEDREEDADLCMMELKRSNLANNIKWIEDGAKAIDYLDNVSNSPRLVLLDLKLPKVSGLDVLRHMRSGSTHQNTPVVVMTSSKEDADVAAAYAIGANSYIVKPVDFGKLTDVVNHVGLYWLVVNEPPTDAS